MDTVSGTDTRVASRRLPWLILIAALLLVATAIAAWKLMPGAGGEPRPAASQLADYGVVPDVQLTERNGHPMGLGELKGRIWVANFIFTRCAGSCPAMSSQMQELQDSLRTVGNVLLVSFTVDPDHDTPQQLQNYAQEYGAREGKWLFLTGTREAMQNLAKDDFHLSMQDGTDPSEPIIHSKRFVLIDRSGHIRGYYNSDEKDAKSRLLRDITVLGEEGA
ncbi:MAG TPA: SCO family protein [Candidatus Kapabacteria bacterium]|nr:SCO family protein [Candidatus Kapabacteria bacterium]